MIVEEIKKIGVKVLREMVDRRRFSIEERKSIYAKG